MSRRLLFSLRTHLLRWAHRHSDVPTEVAEEVVQELLLHADGLVQAGCDEAEIKRRLFQHGHNLVRSWQRPASARWRPSSSAREVRSYG